MGDASAYDYCPQPPPPVHQGRSTELLNRYYPGLAGENASCLQDRPNARPDVRRDFNPEGRLRGQYPPQAVHVEADSSDYGMKKELPTITINEWLQAEQDLAMNRAEPQPGGSMTAEQYALATGRSMGHARKVLVELVNVGKATRQRWHSGTSGPRFVYTLTPLSRRMQLRSRASKKRHS